MGSSEVGESSKDSDFSVDADDDEIEANGDSGNGGGEAVTSVAGPHLDINEANLRQLAESGWESVDIDKEASDDHLDGSTEKYDGMHGPSVTAERAAGEGPLRMRKTEFKPIKMVTSMLRTSIPRKKQ